MLRITSTMMFIITLSKTLDILCGRATQMKWTIGSITYTTENVFGRGWVVSRALIARPGIVNAENARRYIALNIIYAKIFYKFWFINRLMYRVVRTRVAHFIHTGMHYWRFMYTLPPPSSSPSFSPSPRALWSTGEPGLMEKCGVHNSIIDCTYVGVYTSVVFTHPQRRYRCCVCSPRADGGRNIIPGIWRYGGEREKKWKYTDASFALRKYSRINQLASISHEDPNRAALFDVLRSDLL